jgi:3-oxoacyl-[acyl-carrier protein] reductase
MHADLKDQVALVTGASRGIGRSISIALAHCGAHVVITARNVQLLKELEEEINRSGGAATSIPGDLSNENDIASLFEIIRDRMGRLDVIINNAAVGLWGKMENFSIEDYDRMMAINVRGLYLCCQQALRMMIPQMRGFIINISSVVGFKGYPEQSAYTASKHAVMGITKSLAVEAQEHNIQVSAIQPGGVETDLAFQARPDLDPSILIKPDDIAAAVVFLLSLSDRAWIDQIYIRRRNGTPFVGV